MRLLNKLTHELHFFPSDDQSPPYIVLSHRWEGNETSLQEFERLKVLESQQWTPGVAKIMRFCAEMKDREEEWVWVDTVCIDKTSSAELQEAINSMYRWYEQAKLCVVYLSDVSVDENDFAKSAWFTRGWTLQELIAPTSQLFLDRTWTPLGTRTELSTQIQTITGISPSYFGNPTALYSAPVAERMSWLSARTTTRSEDLAYCTLGIFNINMTMLYGEGTKAFQRLQREIIREIEDDSILLWNCPDLPPSSQPTEDGEGQEEGSEEKPAILVPILAPSPKSFAICLNKTVKKSTYFARSPHNYTVAGLEIELYGERMSQSRGTELLVVLNCTLDGARPCFNIQRSRQEVSSGSNKWHRVGAREIDTVGENFPSPPTLQEEFEKRSMDLLSGRSSGSGFGGPAGGMHAGFGGRGGGGGGFAPPHNPGLDSMRFERERVRYKVFVA